MLCYRYQPLNQSRKEVRLLNLMPRGFDDDIVIEILNAVLPEERQEVGSQHIRPDPSRPDPTQLSTSGAQFGIARLAINSAISYEVLSHTWGDDDDQQKITVRDQIQFDDDSSKRLSAYQEMVLGCRPNLRAALRHLRRSDERRILWADAIRIKQNDPIFKSK